MVGQDERCEGKLNQVESVNRSLNALPFIAKVAVKGEKNSFLFDFL